MVSMSLFCRMILSKKSTTFWDHALASLDAQARHDPQHQSAFFNCREQRPIGAGKPDLPIQGFHHFKESIAPDRIEMRGDLVEEDERCQSAHHGNETRMGQNQPGKERFLLSCRGLRRRGLFWAMPHAKIARLRADQRSPG